MNRQQLTSTIRDVQKPVKEDVVIKAAKPEALRADVEGSHSSCVDHLCGCKR